MPERRTILVIDDEEAICSAFVRYFRRRGFEVETALTAAEGRRRAEASAPAVAFIDVRLPDGSGLELLEQFANFAAGTAVIVITAYGSLETVAEAVRRRAFDYLPKPIDLERAELLVERAMRAGRPETSDLVRRILEYAGRSPGALGIVGCSALMQDLFMQTARAAATSSSVLIRGETGTGKEKIARALHELGPRAAKPFVALNCAALPENLVEAELFGYEKGAFTGATREKPGRFETADGGTLFLDEIGELPLHTQGKLLRFLDEQHVERLGTVRSRTVDVRVLAATNRDLDAEVIDGRFREDLFFRLAVISLLVPPLRERPDDILPLAGHFLGELCRETSLPDVAEEVPERLLAYRWPGNVRELHNAVEHAVVASGGALVLGDHLPAGVQNGAPRGETDALPSSVASPKLFIDHLDGEGGDLYQRAVGPVERLVIDRALRECDGNQSAAAERLGIHRNTLRQKIREFGL